MTRRIFLKTGAAFALSVGLLAVCADHPKNHDSRDQRLTRLSKVQINLIQGEAIVAHPANLLE